MNSFRFMTNCLVQLNSALLLICKYLVIALVAIIAIVLIAAVVYRYGLNSALSWAEEFSKYLMVWLTFLGTPIALRHFGHINIDLLVKVLPPRLQQMMYLIVSIIICFTMSIVFLKGVSFAELGARQVASSFNISMFYMYVAVPIGSALTFLVALEQALLSVSGIADPAKGLIVTAVEADAAA